MKTNRVLPLVCFVVLLLVLFLPSSLAQVQTMSTQQLTEQSSAVILGTCVRMESYWVDGNSKIFTRVRIRGEQTLKGEFGGETEITVPGGRIGNMVYEVTDMPIFREGEEVLLFVWQHPTGKQLITGGTQGKFSVETDKTTGRKIIMGAQAQIESASKLQKASSPETQTEKKVFLDDFLTEVRGYVKK
jgi:hypothetical protein